MADEDEADFQDFEEGTDKPVNFGKINPVERAFRANQDLEALKKQKASWQTDGLGIRGSASIVSNASANLVWPTSAVTRRANPELDGGTTAVDADVPTGE
jgi:hypothetical protein